MDFQSDDIENVYIRLSPLSLARKDKEWLKSHSNQSLTSWKNVEVKNLQRFLPLSQYIKAKSDISMLKEGLDKAFYETWERLKVMLIIYF